jgi:PAS domain S-box-containing protein
VEGHDEFSRLATAFNRMSEQLAANTVSLEYLNGVLSNIMNPVVVTTPDGFIRRVNPALENLLGYLEDELLGRPLSAVAPGS